MPLKYRCPNKISIWISHIYLILVLEGYGDLKEFSSNKYGNKWNEIDIKVREAKKANGIESMSGWF